MSSPSSQHYPLKQTLLKWSMNPAGTESLVPDFTGRDAVEEQCYALKGLMVQAGKAQADSENNFDKIILNTLKDAIHIELYLLENVCLWQKKPTVVVNIVNTISRILSNENFEMEPGFLHFLKLLNRIPELLQDSKTALLKPQTIWVEEVINSINTLPTFLKEVATTISGMNSRQMKILEAPLKSASRACIDYKNWLNQKILPNSFDDWALGKDKYSELLSYFYSNQDIDSISEYAEETLNNTTQQLKEFSLQDETRGTNRNSIVTTSFKHPENFQDILNEYSQSFENVKQTMLELDLFSVPDNEKIVVTPTPECLKSFIPFVRLGGTFTKAVNKKIFINGRIWITDPGDSPMMKEHSYPAILNTAIHEGYPGHHLMNAYIQISDNPIHKYICQNFSIGKGVEEGWAHYAETVMVASKIQDYEKIEYTQLKNMKWRAARAILDIALQVEQMPVEQAISRLNQTTNFPLNAAKREVMMYTQNPVYLLSYLFGIDQFNELRSKYVDNPSNSMSIKEFHINVLRIGNVPYESMDKILEIQHNQTIAKGG